MSGARYWGRDGGGGACTHGNGAGAPDDTSQDVAGGPKSEKPVLPINFFVVRPIGPFLRFTQGAGGISLYLGWPTPWLYKQLKLTAVTRATANWET